MKKITFLSFPIDLPGRSVCSLKGCALDCVVRWEIGTLKKSDDGFPRRNEGGGAATEYTWPYRNTGFTSKLLLPPRVEKTV